MLPVNLSPIGDRILVEVDNSETTTASGIVLMERNKTEVEAKVLAVGTGARTEEGILIPMTVTVGSVILFPKSALQEVTINNKKYGVVKERDVFGVIG